MGFFDSIGDAFDSAIDFVSENPIKSLAAVVVTVGTGGIALAYAPVIAATIGGAGLLGTTAGGTVIATLNGAALANASLAALGGGAIAAGGGGMALGTTVVATASTVTGAAISTGAVVATS